MTEEGKYYLIIPDKRYCFDHFLEESKIEEVLRANYENRRVHTVKSIYEHWVLTTHTNTVAHWLGQHDDPNADTKAERAQSVIDSYHSAQGGYIDVHAWQFTPHSFRNLIQELIDRQKIHFNIERVYQTVWGTYEFMAVLSRK